MERQGINYYGISNTGRESVLRGTRGRVSQPSDELTERGGNFLSEKASRSPSHYSCLYASLPLPKGKYRVVYANPPWPPDVIKP